LLDLRERMQRDGAEHAVADSDERKLDEAWDALTWWRSLHARPLSTVAANLRYHVDRGDARVLGRIEVAQRLKRLDTLIGKLGRERGNVTQMQDIGGVRAVLPSLRHVYVVRRRLLKSWVIIRERDYIAQPKSSGYRRCT
jgi:ppGpp synthetase/RelA/SpoT-type nucleotidyltranferase